ncbi:MAG: YceI family protein [Acidobacteriota bacterium]|nr:YceI family protein [Acidobacteriota bacterium]
MTRPTRGILLALVTAVALLAVLLLGSCDSPSTTEEAAGAVLPELQPIPADAEQFAIGGTSGVFFAAASERTKPLASARGMNGALALTTGTADGAVLQFDFDPRTISGMSDDAAAALGGADFLEAGRFPSASFHSIDVRTADTGFEVEGVLELRGVKQRVTFPAQIVVGESQVTAQAELAIDRDLFGLPAGPDPELILRLHLEASRLSTS